MDVNTPPEVPFVLSKNFFFMDVWFMDVCLDELCCKEGEIIWGEKFISSVTLLDIKGTMQLIVTV